MVRGTRPPNSDTIFFAAPVIDLALLLKSPVDRISCARTSVSTAAKSAGVGYLANSPGVTSLTRLSVHCAERIVATSSSQGLRCVSAQVTSGYIWSSRFRISAIRAWRSAAVLGRATLADGSGFLGKPYLSIGYWWYVCADLPDESAVANRENLRRVRKPLQLGAHHAGVAEVPDHHRRARHHPQGRRDRIPNPLAGPARVLENPV